jgi:hypothetical protein
MVHSLGLLTSLAATDIDSSGCASLNGLNELQKARVSLGSRPKVIHPDKNSIPANERVANADLISAKVEARKIH